MTMPPTDCLVLTANEVAVALRISKRGVYRLLAEGSLPSPILVGRRKRWSRKVIEAFAEGQKVTRRGNR